MPKVLPFSIQILLICIAHVAFLSTPIYAQLHQSVIKDQKAFEADSSSVTEIRIDPILTNQAITSSFVDSLVLIPLETNDNSTFKKVSQLEATKEYFIIWDELSNSIFIFRKNGKFHAVINNKDKNPNGFNNINRFTVNETNKEILFDDYHSIYQYAYSFDGKFIRRTNKPSYMGYSNSVVGDLTIYYQNYDAPNIDKSSFVNNLVLVKNGSIQSQYLPYSPQIVDYTDIYSVDQNFYNQHDKTLLLSRPYDYTIYCLNRSGSLFKKFKFVLPAHIMLPDDFMTNLRYNKMRYSYTSDHSDVIYAITNVYQSGASLSFELFGHASNQSYLYNLKSRTLVNFADILSDQKTFFFPLVGEKICAKSPDGAFISAIPAETLFDIRRQLLDNEEWKESLPTNIKSFFENGTKQNHVLSLIYTKNALK